MFSPFFIALGLNLYLLKKDLSLNPLYEKTIFANITKKLVKILLNINYPSQI